MADVARLIVDDKEIELPVVVGSEQERAIDISVLRSTSGYITLDEGYGNTGSCRSAITYIDGEEGVLRYRGIPIEVLAEKSNFIETAYLLISGKLPTTDELSVFSSLLSEHAMLREQIRHQMTLFPPGSDPMAVLSAVLSSLACYYPELLDVEDGNVFQEAAARIMSKVRTIAAYAYKQYLGHNMPYSRHDFKYAANFLHMMFTQPYKDYEPNPEEERALDVLLILHADHEQNCSTSTVRMVGSSGANLFSSVAAGVSALWGPLHGGANVAGVDMIESLIANTLSVKEYVQQVKDKKAGIRLMGFGHRVYKNFDPRATIIKQQCEIVLSRLGKRDAMLDVAQELESAALEDDYFVERKLYPNVDFYSGVILRALGIPKSMFTAIFITKTIFMTLLWQFNIKKLSI